MFQLLEHLNTNKLQPQFQSAYCACHSTETALLRVLNDLLNASDNGQMSLLILLELNAVFHTIAHRSLLHRLKHIFGMQKPTLSVLSDQEKANSIHFLLHLL